MMDEVEEDAGFPNEEVQRCLQEAAEGVLETATWDEKMVPIWQNEIIERAMKQIIDRKEPYKYVVTCMLV